MERFEAHLVLDAAQRSIFLIRGTVFEFKVAACGEAVCVTIAQPARYHHGHVCAECKS
jgi:hypothetical protein